MSPPAGKLLRAQDTPSLFTSELTGQTASVVIPAPSSLLNRRGLSNFLQFDSPRNAGGRTDRRAETAPNTVLTNRISVLSKSGRYYQQDLTAFADSDAAELLGWRIRQVVQFPSS